MSGKWQVEFSAARLVRALDEARPCVTVPGAMGTWACDLFMGLSLLIACANGGLVEQDRRRAREAAVRAMEDGETFSVALGRALNVVDAPEHVGACLQRCVDVWSDIRKLLGVDGRLSPDGLLVRITRPEHARQGIQWLRALLQDRRRFNFALLFRTLTVGDADPLQEHEDPRASVQALNRALERGRVGWYEILRALLMRTDLLAEVQRSAPTRVRGVPVVSMFGAWACIWPEPERARPLDEWLAQFRDDLDSAFDAARNGQFEPISGFDLSDGARLLVRRQKSAQTSTFRRPEYLLDLSREAIQALQLQSEVRSPTMRVSIALTYALRHGKESFAQRVMPTLFLFGDFDNSVRTWLDPRQKLEPPVLAPGTSLQHVYERAWQIVEGNVRSEGARPWTIARLYIVFSRALVEGAREEVMDPANYAVAPGLNDEWNRERWTELSPVMALPDVAAILKGTSDWATVCEKRELHPLTLGWIFPLLFLLGQSYVDLSNTSRGRLAARRESGLRPPRIVDSPSRTGTIGGGHS